MLVQHCTNVLQLFCVYWDALFFVTQEHQKPSYLDYPASMIQRWSNAHNHCSLNSQRSISFSANVTRWIGSQGDNQDFQL